MFLKFHQKSQLTSFGAFEDTDLSIKYSDTKYFMLTGPLKALLWKTSNVFFFFTHRHEKRAVLLSSDCLP